MTDQDPIVVDFVVNCGGLWARDLGHLPGAAFCCMLVIMTAVLIVVNITVAF
jgi:glycine/D-amino acid oxidase-like deaminating enzyme